MALSNLRKDAIVRPRAGIQYPATKTMRKLFIQPSDCQFTNTANKIPCAAPVNWYHTESGKCFCRVHYGKIRQISSGWINLERKDSPTLVAENEKRLEANGKKRA